MNAIKKTTVTMLMALAFSPAIAQQDFNFNDVVGMFSDTSHVGPNAGTATVGEAHFDCMSRMPDAAQESRGITSTAYEDYRSCMADYVPFKVPGDGDVGSCASQTVTWGQCSATLPSIPGGASFSVRNTLDPENYEGFASFQCSDGNITYQSGGCSRAVNECDAGEVVNWPVTYPSWAQENPSEVYEDKFGHSRHTPKDRCYSRMPGALSGFLTQARGTTPEIADPNRYVVGAAEAPKRCFDGEWLDEPGSGPTNCEYIPKNCEATTFETPRGCTFELPDGEHDEIFNDSNPNPQNSEGFVVAYCWDGEWEIRNQSCILSCEASVSSRSWSGDDPRSCGHGQRSLPNRLPPGGTMIVNNNVSGMDGSTVYACDDGVLDVSSDSCEPQSCDGVSAYSWSGSGGAQCSHSARSKSDSHGATYTVNVGSLTSEARGYAEHRCSYGEWSVISDYCAANQIDICRYEPGTSTRLECQNAGGSYNDATETCCFAGDNGINCGGTPPPPPSGPGCPGVMPPDCDSSLYVCDCDCGYWRVTPNRSGDIRPPNHCV